MSLFEGQLWKCMPICDGLPLHAKTTIINRLTTGVFTEFESRSLQKTTSKTPVKLNRYVKNRSQNKLSIYQSSKDAVSSWSFYMNQNQPFLDLWLNMTWV